MDRYAWIDPLKGLGIVAVVMIHVGLDYKESNIPFVLYNIIFNGGRAVQLFFILSAFLAFTSLSKLRSLDSHNCITWWLNRFFRLAPLFYLALFVYILTDSVSYYALGTEKTVSVYNILANLFFVHGFFPHYINSILGVNWYVADLAIFYFFAPFLFKKLNNLKVSIAFAILSIVISYFFSYSFYRLDLISDKVIWNDYVRYNCILAQLPPFALGIVLYHLLKLDWLDRYDIGYLKYYLLALTLYLLAGFMVGSGLVGVSQVACFSFLLFFLIICIRLCHIRLDKIGILNSLGKYSYGIYLFHFLILYRVQGIIKIPNPTLSFVVKWFVVVLLSYLLAVILDWTVDKPIQKIVRRYIK